MTARPDLYDPSLTVRLGIAGHGLLGVGVPASLACVVAPLSRSGFDIFLDGLIIALVLAIPIAVGTPIALVKRPRWGRRWAVVVSKILLTGWAGTLALTFGYPLGLLHAGSDSTGSLAPFGWTGFVFLIVLTLPAWWVLRLLRDPAVRPVNR